MLGAVSYRGPSRGIVKRVVQRLRPTSGSSYICDKGCWHEGKYCVCPEDLVTLGAVTKRGGGGFLDLTRFLPAVSPGIAPGMPSVPTTVDTSTYLSPELPAAAPFWTPGRIAAGVGVSAAAVLGVILLRRR